MIVMVLGSALAAPISAERLAAAAPSAVAQLEVCAHAAAACDPDAAARAAWLVAVHIYVSEGIADGQLAATVKVLHPELFGDLPSVVREAASSPFEWTDAVLDEPVPQAVIKPPTATGPAIARAAAEGRLVPGVYWSLAELRDNAPHEPWPNAVIEAGRDSAMFDGFVDVYKIDRPVAKTLGPIAGFCDGERVYIHVDGMGKATGKFVPLDFVGPWAYYETVGETYSYSNGGVQRWTYRERNLMALDDGTHFVFNKRLLRRLIGADEGLLAKFNRETGKRRKMRGYLASFYGES